jgi:hypothetical protein
VQGVFNNQVIMHLCALQHAKTAYSTETQISDGADGTPEGIAEPLWRQGGGNVTPKMSRSGFALPITVT